MIPNGQHSVTMAICRLPKVNLNNKIESDIPLSAVCVPGGILQIHVDKPAGPVIASTTIGGIKNGWQISRNSCCSAPAGVHDLYFTYTNRNLKKPEDTGVTFDWFYFQIRFRAKENLAMQKQKKVLGFTNDADAYHAGDDGKS